jgi:hypothetical protein
MWERYQQRAGQIMRSLRIFASGQREMVAWDRSTVANMSSFSYSSTGKRLIETMLNSANSVVTEPMCGTTPAAMHPTVKPVALIADAILDCSARGDIVLDSFLGSGSTILAAERVGRIGYGIELDPIYVEIAIRRWQSYTGEQAIHAESGKAFDELAAQEVGTHE